MPDFEWFEWRTFVHGLLGEFIVGVGVVFRLHLWVTSREKRKEVEVKRIEEARRRADHTRLLAWLESTAIDSFEGMARSWGVRIQSEPGLDGLYSTSEDLKGRLRSTPPSALVRTIHTSAGYTVARLGEEILRYSREVSNYVPLAQAIFTDDPELPELFAGYGGTSPSSPILSIR